MSNLYLISLVTSFLFIALGAFVWIKNHKQKINRLFVVICMFLSIVTLSDYITSFITNIEMYVFQIKLFYFLYALLFVLLFEFTLEYIKYSDKILRLIHFSIMGILGGVILLTDLIISGAIKKDSGFSYVPGLFQKIYLFYIFITMIYLIKLVMNYYFSTKKLVDKNRILYLITGLIVVIVSQIFDALRRHGIYTLIDYPLKHFAFLIFFIITSYTIVKYKLMHIDFVLKKGLIISLISTSIAVLFEILTWGIDHFIILLTGNSSDLVSLFGVVICAFSFEPIKNKINSAIDHVYK